MKNSKEKSISLVKSDLASVIEKFLDIAIGVLLVMIFVLSMRIFLRSDIYDTTKKTVLDRIEIVKKGLPSKKSDLKNVPVTVDSSFRSDREYPDYISEDEKFVLMPQSEGSQVFDEAKSWEETVKSLAVVSDRLVLKRLGDDCFADPTVLRTRSGSMVRVYNESDQQISMGYSQKNWNIPARSHLDVDFGVATSAEDGGFSIFGFGCGNVNEPSGLILVD